MKAIQLKEDEEQAHDDMKKMTEDEVTDTMLS